MSQTYNKKLIEVAIPLEAINAASAREKSIRHGHPSTLHLWWARRPLAACRAVLFAQLVDDPSSHPDMFPTEAAVEAERKRLFEIIEELVTWENSTNEEVLDRARAEIRKSCGGELPPTYDPFSGGGSIPLEAQRLGLPAYGSDLNPVAVMIGKAMLEIPPLFKHLKPVHPGGVDKLHYKNAEGLAEDVQYYGGWMRDRAFERIGHFYPQIDLPREYGGGKATVIAWIWARTVPSPDPAFAGAMTPLISSFILSLKKDEETWIRSLVDKEKQHIKYIINTGGTAENLCSAREGTKFGRANFRCLFSNAAITPEYIKEMGIAGRISQQMIAIVAERRNGRAYLSPTKEQEEMALSACPAWKPETPLPAKALGFRIQNYGMKTYGDLFFNRQLLTLTTFVDLIAEVREIVQADAIKAKMDEKSSTLQDCGNSAYAYAEAVAVYLTFIVCRMADLQNNLCQWRSDAAKQHVGHLFSRQAIPMTWDFGEANPFCSSAGSWEKCKGFVPKVIEQLIPGAIGSITQADASTRQYDHRNVVISTDPPYYDNIGYADLSDFFFCWLKPSLKSIYPDLFSILATPKSEELIAASFRHGGKEAAETFFLNGMRHAISQMATQTDVAYPISIYYAFKQSEIQSEGISSTGWATFLAAVIQAGLSIVGTWPVRTELANRIRGIGANALANSVVLVCRKKSASAGIISRAEFVRALKRELPPAIAELQAANIAPADMPQSSIGPGMGIYSRYEAVLESDDSPMSVKVALQLINRELDEYLGGIEGEFDADTRFAITWFEQNGMINGDYGTANSIAQARGISVESVKHAGIVESAASKVRILARIIHEGGGCGASP
jgi:putative DNA methylase